MTNHSMMNKDKEKGKHIEFELKSNETLDKIYHSDGEMGGNTFN